MLLKNFNKLKILSIIVFILVLIPAIFSLLHNGFFVSDDGNWMVIRFSAFYEVLRHGQFPVRFLTRLNNGYGYPVADFLYPLFMYIGVPIHVIGFNFVNTIKIIFGISLISSSIFCFLWLRRLFDNLSSFIGSLVYLYFPYHLWDVYKRGSIGEVLALAVVPFILWQIERKSFVLSAVGISLLILSHNTLALLFTTVIVFYMLINVTLSSNKKNIIYQYINILVLGFLGSAFFWLPALYDLQYTVFLKTQVSNWDKYFSGLRLIGLSTIVILVLTVLLIINGKVKIKRHRLTMLFFIVGGLSIFLSISKSYFIWQLLPVSFIQFPFRFLSITVLCVSFLAACIISLFSIKKKILISVFILAIVFISSWSFLFPKKYQYFPDSYYSTNQDTTTVKNEYMPKWVKNVPQTMPANKAEVVGGKGKINIINMSVNKIIMQVYLHTKRTIQVNMIYFPGWIIYADGRKVKIDYNVNGLIRFDIPSGNHTILLEFEETRLRLLADIISFLTLLVMFTLFVKKIFKKV